ncbi:unnamed protein product [Linum tenue]|uniref:Mitochondrial carrier protein n=1 Tax=Linum tenue TaxID=586396 RepID=A0AAV0RHD5_9ROSI|nr:unnamed protein product [Linum tenue]
MSKKTKKSSGTSLWRKNYQAWYGQWQSGNHTSHSSHAEEAVGGVKKPYRFRPGNLSFSSVRFASTGWAALQDYLGVFGGAGRCYPKTRFQRRREATETEEEEEEEEERRSKKKNEIRKILQPRIPGSEEEGRTNPDPRRNQIGEILVSRIGRQSSGILPSLAGISHVAIQFPAYEKIKSYMAARDNTTVDKLGPVKVAIASSIAKVVASVTTYPHEVIPSRLQEQGQVRGSEARYAGVVDCVRKVFLKEGLPGFYRGCATNLMRTTPSAVITFTSYEMIHRLLERLILPDKRHPKPQRENNQGKGGID